MTKKELKTCLNIMYAAALVICATYGWITTKVKHMAD